LPYLLVAAVTAFAAPAHAEVSSWLAASGGTSILTVNESEVMVRGTMNFDLGVGSTPQADAIFGGLFRVAPIFDEGTDLVFLVRGCSRGFQTGDWGVAVDLGGYLRLFDPDVETELEPFPQGGFLGEVILGAPLGFQLALAGHAGTLKSYGGSAVIGLDLLKLTVYRQSLLEWWPNPLSPADKGPGDTRTAGR
jgi:hypothetical protein